MFAKNFKKNPKIKQITSCSSGDFLFVFGLSRDGRMYVWNSNDCVWMPHINTQAEAQNVGNS